MKPQNRKKSNERNFAFDLIMWHTRRPVVTRRNAMAIE